MSVSIYEAKSTLSKLIEEVERTGGEIVIRRHNTPVAERVPFVARMRPRTPGGWEGRVVVHDDFDTHVVLWAFSEPERLSAWARSAIIDPTNEVAVSAATIWEIEIKRALGKLDAPPGTATLCVEREFDPLPITFEHAEQATQLPPHHGDPFDRMLIGQAISDGYRIATVDRAFADDDVELLDPLEER